MTVRNVQQEQIGRYEAGGLYFVFIRLKMRHFTKFTPQRPHMCKFAPLDKYNFYLFISLSVGF